MNTETNKIKSRTIGYCVTSETLTSGLHIIEKTVVDERKYINQLEKQIRRHVWKSKAKDRRK